MNELKLVNRLLNLCKREGRRFHPTDNDDVVSSMVDGYTEEDEDNIEKMSSLENIINNKYSTDEEIEKAQIEHNILSSNNLCYLIDSTKQILNFQDYEYVLITDYGCCFVFIRLTSKLDMVLAKKYVRKKKCVTNIWFEMKRGSLSKVFGKRHILDYLDSFPDLCFVLDLHDLKVSRHIPYDEFIKADFDLTDNDWYTET